MTESYSINTSNELTPHSSINMVFPPCIRLHISPENIFNMIIRIVSRDKTQPLMRPYTQSIAWVIDEYEKACKYLELKPGYYDGTSTAKATPVMLHYVKITKNGIEFYNYSGHIIFSKYIHNPHKVTSGYINDLNPPAGWLAYQVGPRYRDYVIFKHKTQAMVFDPVTYLAYGRADCSSFINIHYDLFNIIMKTGKLSWIHFRKLADACPAQFRQIMMRYVNHVQNISYSILAVLELKKDDEAEACAYNRITNYAKISIDTSLCLAAGTYDYNNSHAAVWDLATGCKLFEIGRHCTGVYIYNPENKGTNKYNTSQRKHMKVRRFIKTHCKGINKERAWIIVIGDHPDEKKTVENMRACLKKRIKDLQQIIQDKLACEYLEYMTKHKICGIKYIPRYRREHISYHYVGKEMRDISSYINKLNNIESFNDIEPCHYVYTTCVNFIPIDVDPTTGYYKMPSDAQTIIQPSHVQVLDKEKLQTLHNIIHPNVYCGSDGDNIYYMCGNIDNTYRNEHLTYIINQYGSPLNKGECIIVAKYGPNNKKNEELKKFAYRLKNCAEYKNMISYIAYGI